jgi:hypothetical protein
VKLSRTLPALLVASMAIVAACGGDDDDASTPDVEEPGSGDTGTAENGETDEPDGGGDSGVDPCTLGQDAAEQTLAGATCEHSIDGIEDETAVWSRDGEEVLRVAVYAEEIDEFPTMEDEEANRDPVFDEANTYETAPELGDRAWILTVPDGPGEMGEGMTAHMETDRYMLITVNSTVLERADLVTTASAVLEDATALG